MAQAHQPLAAVWLASLLVQGRSDDRLRWHTQSQGHEPAQGDRALARPHEWGRTGEPILTIDAPVVYTALHDLPRPHNRAGERCCRGLDRGAA